MTRPCDAADIVTVLTHSPPAQVMNHIPASHFAKHHAFRHSSVASVYAPSLKMLTPPVWYFHQHLAAPIVGISAFAHLGSSRPRAVIKSPRFIERDGNGTTVQPDAAPAQAIQWPDMRHTAPAENRQNHGEFAAFPSL